MPRFDWALSDIGEIDELDPDITSSPAHGVSGWDRRTIREVSDSAFFVPRTSDPLEQERRERLINTIEGIAGPTYRTREDRIFDLLSVGNMYTWPDPQFEDHRNRYLAEMGYHPDSQIPVEVTTVPSRTGVLTSGFTGLMYALKDSVPAFKKYIGYSLAPAYLSDCISRIKKEKLSGSVELNDYCDMMLKGFAAAKDFIKNKVDSSLLGSYVDNWSYYTFFKVKDVNTDTLPRKFLVRVTDIIMFEFKVRDDGSISARTLSMNGSTFVGGHTRCLYCDETYCKSKSSWRNTYKYTAEGKISHYNSYSLCVSCKKKGVKVSFICSHCNDFAFNVKSPFLTKIRSCVSCGMKHRYTCKKCHKNFMASTDQVLCRKCRTEDMFVCEDCGKTKPGIEKALGTHRDYPLCLSCDNSHIREYNYVPSMIQFHATFETSRIKNTLFYGLEIEVEGPRLADRSISKNSYKSRTEHPELFNRKNINEVTISSGILAKELEAKKLGLIKRDGSLSNGFEIVLSPMTYEFIKRSPISRDLFDKIESLRKWGFTSSDNNTCGIHVHMSRSAFTPIHLLNFCEFICENPGLTFKVSQRETNMSMNRWASLDFNRSQLINSFIGSEGEDYGPGIVMSEKYRAVNLRHKDTIEVRIFNGSLKKETILKNIQFCDSVFWFTKTTEKEKQTEFYYKKFLRANAHKYKELVAFLRKPTTKTEAGY